MSAAAALVTEEREATQRGAVSSWSRNRVPKTQALVEREARIDDESKKAQLALSYTLRGMTSVKQE